MTSQLLSDGSLIITTPSRLFVEDMGRYVPGYAAVSITQDGGHVRTGYDLNMLRTLGDDCGLTLISHAWLMPGAASDVRWHLNPGPSPVGALARNIRDIFARRNAGFVIGGPPKSFAHRYMTISATFSSRNHASSL